MCENEKDSVQGKVFINGIEHTPEQALYAIQRPCI